MPTRQELVLSFMLALAGNSTWHDPEIILNAAQELADEYLKSLG